MSPSEHQPKAPTRPTEPFRVVTHKNWLAEQFKPMGAVQDFGFDIDAQTAMSTIWWAPGAWVASAAKVGLKLPLMSNGPYWLDKLPVRYKKRGVVTMTAERCAALWDDHPPALIPRGRDRSFIKLPEAKVDNFPARVHYFNRHWATTIGQYHLPPQTLIQVQEPMEFEVEGRFWVIGSSVVAKSLYRIHDVVWGDERFNDAFGDVSGIARDLHAFAREVAEEVEAAPAYVLDVGTIKGQDDPVVVEANAAWSSGPYDGDPEWIYRTIRASHDFEGKYPQWAWQPNPVFDKVGALREVSRHG